MSSIFNHGKVKCLDVWLADDRKDEITSVFISLGIVPSAVSDYQLDVLEHYLKRIYSPTAKTLSRSLADDRLTHLHRLTDNDVRKLPMSRPALLQHTNRSCFQAGYLWMECVLNVVLPNPELWGWKRHEGSLVPNWQDATSEDINSVLKTCTCQTNICNACSCAKKELSCLPLCNCRQNCKNKCNKI